MGYFQEEKALGDEFMDSLEQKISAFFSESSDESNRSYDDDDGEGNEEETHDPVERAEFWQTQEKLLQQTIGRSNSSGSRLRREVKRSLDVIRERYICHCQRPSFNGCSSCFRRAMVDQLQAVGYDAALCISRWKSTREIPAGMHEYIDVIIHATDAKKEGRFVVELEFRAEFDIAKACDDYRKLINQLPEFYVGKNEHLNTMVRIACDAGKRSMKEKKLHMGPWRKRKFMQKKWSTPSHRLSLDQSPDVSRFPGEPHMRNLGSNFSFPAAATVQVA